MSAIFNGVHSRFADGATPEYMHDAAVRTKEGCDSSEPQPSLLGQECQLNQLRSVVSEPDDTVVGQTRLGLTIQRRYDVR